MLTKFDMAAFQLPPRHSLRQRIAPLTIRKPDPQEFFRVHPGDDYTGDFSLLEDKSTRKIYIVHPDIAEEVGRDAFAAELHLAVNLEGGYFITFCKYPSRPDEPYATTRIEVVEEAKLSWVRMVHKTNGDGYQSLKAGSPLPAPTWPDTPFLDLLSSLGDRLITDLCHPVLMRLRGEL